MAVRPEAAWSCIRSSFVAAAGGSLMRSPAGGEWLAQVADVGTQARAACTGADQVSAMAASTETAEFAMIVRASATVSGGSPRLARVGRIVDSPVVQAAREPTRRWARGLPRSALIQLSERTSIRATGRGREGQANEGQRGGDS